MAGVNVHCPRCQPAQVYRHGQNPEGHGGFRCRDCHRVFQLTYAYEARKPGSKREHEKPWGSHRMGSLQGVKYPPSFNNNTCWL